jgi:hypothetical protein
MERTRVTISLSPRSEDAVTVLRALEKVKHWRRSAELLRWAAAYLNGEALQKTEVLLDMDLTDAELDALLDDF